jgi:hypothetical protein
MICLRTVVRYMTLAAKLQRQPPELVLPVTKIADRKTPVEKQTGLRAGFERVSRPGLEPGTL